MVQGMNNLSDLSIPVNEWYEEQWIYCYIYSDAATDTRGFGTYAPGIGA